MSKLNIELDYIKMAQYLKFMHFAHKNYNWENMRIAIERFEKILDDAVREKLNDK